MSINNRLHFGLPAQGFLPGVMHLTGDAGRVYQTVEACLRARLLAAVIAPRGAGKTAAVRAALDHHPEVALVEPVRLVRERLHLGDIAAAIVRDLSDETARQSGEARSHQVRRILGEAARDGRAVLLLIDDVHVLHHSTLRGLKRLLELSWAGRSPLLSILLVGQQDRAAAVPEVGLRTETVTLAGLSGDEVAGYLRQYGAETFASPFIEAVAAHPRARNWLDLRRLLDDALAAARAAGATRLTAEHLRAPANTPTRTAEAPGAAVDALLARRAGEARRAA